MINYFNVIYSDEVEEFLDSLENKVRLKIIYNIDKARINLDPELFRKLDADIWEFRTKYNRKQYRLLAFWDKRKPVETLVIATHGFLKKTKKTPKSEMDKARKIMEIYFNTM